MVTEKGRSHWYPIEITFSHAICYKWMHKPKPACCAQTIRTAQATMTTPLHHPITHLSPHYFTMMNDSNHNFPWRWRLPFITLQQQTATDNNNNDSPFTTSWLMTTPFFFLNSLHYFTAVKFLRSPSDCRDPVWSKINPLLLLQLHPNHPLRIWHYANQNPELQVPPKPSDALLSLSKLQTTSENPNHIPVFICLHHSILVLLNSKLIFMSSSQFSPFHLQYIKPFQYSRSLILASTLLSYISASFLLNSSNSL